MPWTIPKSRCCESEYSEFTSPDVEYHSEKAEKQIVMFIGFVNIRDFLMYDFF